MIHRPSLAEEIRARLREQILTGQLAPGQQLTEQGVAQMMGTSPGPVRESFASLCQEGLLISLPRRGTFVAGTSESESIIAYQVRSFIEPYAAELSMPMADEKTYARMAASLDAMRAAANRGDLVQHLQHDIEFHTVFYDLSGSELLKTVWNATSTKILRFMSLAAPHYVPDLNETAEKHVVLLGLFRAHDVEGLRVAISSHVGDLWKRIKAAELADPEALGRAGPGA
jgi:GntR family transcriptional regulator, gluconate operon transcriptional repressor